ncbi:replicative DNA helicase [Microbacterium sp. MMO-10]|uniref:replicative DNA helicase n=1 Tax=Microbacterium sp. MMO-10 TaxID=3081272 RepID=UPI00301AEC12
MIWDKSAEQSALGAAMLDHRRAWDVLDIAPPKDFHDPGHFEIADAIRRLAIRGAGTDPVLVGDELRAQGVRIHQGEHYLFELTSLTPTAVNGGHYAQIVAECAVRRRLAEAADVVRMLAAKTGIPTDDLVESARGVLDGIVAGTVDAHLVAATIDEVIASLAEKPELVPTPWRDVNALIGGLRPGAVYVVGARPATGKTALGLNLAVEVARTGKAAAFVSLEMSEGELQKRLIAQLGSVHMSRLVNNALEDDDMLRVQAAREQIMKLPIAVADNAAATVATIRGHVRSVSRRQEVGCLVVDYVQLLQGSDPSKSRQQVVGEFSRAMKLIAKEFHIPVVVLSQLNRKSEERMDKRPSIADLRESGDLEQDADVVLLLWRDDRDDDMRGEVGVIVAKNRHGTTGDVRLAWSGHYQQMNDLAKGWEPGA